ncbi:putative transcriptional regulator [Mycobacteroides abscessus subsp. massiliense]|nr:putative transcriptional regulator [Mycobacteroides abscessus subsp. massiliense]
MCAIRMGLLRSGLLRLGRMGLDIMSSPAQPVPRNETTRVFGDRLRAAREELALSQEAAAQRCGIHWTALGKIERGQRSLRLETLVKLLDGLDLDADDLLNGLPVPPPDTRD